MKKFIYIIKQVEGRYTHIVNGEAFQSYNKALEVLQEKARLYSVPGFEAVPDATIQDQYYLKENGRVIGQMFIESLTVVK